MKNKENNDPTSMFILVGFILFGVYTLLKPTIDRIQAWIQAVNWTKLIFITVIIIISFILIFISIRRFYSKIKERREQKENEQEELEKQEKQLLNKIKTNFYGESSDKTKDKLKEIKLFINKLPEELTLKYKKDINKFYKNSKTTIIKKIQEEYKEKLERIKDLRKQEQDENKFKRQVNELFLFKKSKSSIEALPLNKIYPENVIREAEDKIKSYLSNQKRIKDIKQEAINYYKNNDLDTKPNLSKEQEYIYKQVREEIKEGKIQLKKDIIVKGKKLKNNFYRAKELNEEEKRNALTQNFKHIRGIELNGLICGGGYYIKKNFEKESNYHFIMKYLFKELNPDMRVEYSIDGKRVDVAYVKDDFKLGIEVETGSNKIEQLTAKIPWLNLRFNKWIFVCSRKNLYKYSRYVDNKKSFCLGTKKAKEKVLNIINSYDTAIQNR